MSQLRRLLHVASFDGNIGDNASHNGLYRTLAANTGWTLQTECREIRKTYLRYDGPDPWRWDAAFIESVNRQDLTLVGGGNYFELWVEPSVTGTTVDLDPALLRNLQRPLVFHGVGCDPCKGYSAETLARFRRFLDAVTEQPLCRMAVRNDGSLTHLQAHFGTQVAAGVLVTPDPGFFVDPCQGELPLNLDGQPYWALNLAVDMPGLRFPGGEDALDYPAFIQQMRDWLVWALGRWSDRHLVLVPHIYSDLKPINDLLEILPDYLRRQRISVAPYLHGDGSEQKMFRIYQQAELAMGTRFHANVCPIGLGTPTIGLVTYRKLADLYGELGMPDRAVMANTVAGIRHLIPLFERTMGQLCALRTEYAALKLQLLAQARQVHREIALMVDAASGDC